MKAVCYYKYVNVQWLEIFSAVTNTPHIIPALNLNLQLRC